MSLSVAEATFEALLKRLRRINTFSDWTVPEKIAEELCDVETSRTRKKEDSAPAQFVVVHSISYLYSRLYIYFRWNSKSEIDLCQSRVFTVRNPSTASAPPVG